MTGGNITWIKSGQELSAGDVIVYIILSLEFTKLISQYLVVQWLSEWGNTCRLR
jgi:hypothetical protein